MARQRLSTVIDPSDDTLDRLRRYESLQAGLDLIDQGFTLIDANLRILAWNEAFIRLLDFPREMAFVGATFESFMRYNAERGDYGPGDADAQVAERMSAARRFAPHEIERVRPNGRVLRVRGVPVPGIGFVTLYSDITAQRQAEQTIREHTAELERRVAERTAELRHSEAQLRLITDSIPALVAYIDVGRRYRYANRSYREWFGLDTDRPDTFSARDFLGRATFESIRPHFTRAFAGEATSFEYDITRRDGSQTRVRTSLVPDIGGDSGVAGCYELTFDITEQQRAQALVLKAQKMEALGQLTGGLAHDFNNLLTVVIGNLGLLAHRREQDSDIEEYVEPALQAARRGVDLVRRLLSFARRQPLVPNAVDVSQVVASVTRIASRSMPESLQIEVHAPPTHEALWAWVEASELENALLNLLLNARDATAGNGQVQVHVSRARVGAQDAQRLGMAQGEAVRLAVSDNGCGMNEATLQRVYEPFFTTKPPGSGTGLGMAMVYGLVTQSAGAIDIVSKLDEGTTVTLWLPACEAPGDEQVDVSRGGLSAAQPQGLALLVEDDPGVRRVVRRQLLELGYTVLEAENGVEAREILERTGGVMLLLTDVVMPGGVDGRALAREARELHHVPRVLLMSGHAPGTTDPRGPALLDKPFSKAQLAAALVEAAS